MKATIFFDMDGTIADLYGVPNWLDYLMSGDAYPYEAARPLVQLNVLARYLNRLQKAGYKIGIISWLAKCDNDDYHVQVTAAKVNWLHKHLPSVHFDEIHIVAYGTAKESFAHTTADILFDDEQPNREHWTGRAFNVDSILETLKTL